MLPHLLVSATPLAIAGFNSKLSGEDVCQLGTKSVSAPCDLHSTNSSIYSAYMPCGKPYLHHSSAVPFVLHHCSWS